MFQKKSTRDLVQSGSADAPADGGRPNKKEKAKRPPRDRPPMDVKGLLRSKSFLGGLCIFLGLVIALGAIPVLKARVADVIPVYTFTRAVQRGTQLTADMLVETAMSNYNLPAGVVPDRESVLGGYLTADVIDGDVLTAARISPQYPGDDPALTQLPPGKLAVSVSLSSMSQSLSSKLRAGDVIQVFAMGKQETDGAGATAAEAPSQLQYIEVLSISDPTGLDVSAAGANQIETVTLIADRDQAAALVALEHSATIHAALVVRGDDGRKTELLLAQQKILDDLRATEVPVSPTVPSAEGGT